MADLVQLFVYLPSSPKEWPSPRSATQLFISTRLSFDGSVTAESTCKRQCLSFQKLRILTLFLFAPAAKLFSCAR